MSILSRNASCCVGLSLIATETVCCLVDTANKHITHHAPGAGVRFMSWKAVSKVRGRLGHVSQALWSVWLSGGQSAKCPSKEIMEQGTDTEIKWAGAMKSWIIICVYAKFLWSIINNVSVGGNGEKTHAAPPHLVQ